MSDECFSGHKRIISKTDVFTPWSHPVKNIHSDTINKLVKYPKYWTRAGINCEDINLQSSYPLGQYTSGFQVEMYAILLVQGRQLEVSKK